MLKKKKQRKKAILLLKTDVAGHYLLSKNQKKHMMHSKPHLKQIKDFSFLTVVSQHHNAYLFLSIIQHGDLQTMESLKRRQKLSKKLERKSQKNTIGLSMKVLVGYTITKKITLLQKSLLTNQSKRRKMHSFHTKDQLMQPQKITISKKQKKNL